MSDEQITKVLKSIGLTRKEAEIYIFLSKYGAQKGLEIANRTKTHKALVYRIVKNLQSKGVIELTLESPTRFVAIPFEKVLDNSIKQKREEVDSIEKAKKEVLSQWRRLDHPELEKIERFLVIQGNRNIYSKMIDMAKEAKTQVAALLSVPGFAHIEQYGVFDPLIHHPLKDKLEIRFLSTTETTSVRALNSHLESISNTGLNLQLRDYCFGSKSLPKMFIQDQNELLFFISDKSEDLGKDAICVWTNCKTLVRSFMSTFEESWRHSIDSKEKTKRRSIELLPGSSMLGGKAKEEFKKVLSSCKREVIATASSENVATFNGLKQELSNLAKRGVSIKLMVPFSSENLSVLQQLCTTCEIRHVPDGYSDIHN